MSEPPKTDPEPKPTYDQFKEIYDKHPDLDNGEYYAEFPKGNKSTIRSWKNRAAFVEPTPGEPPQVDKGLKEQQDHYIQLLMTQTNSKDAEFEGVDQTSKILVLRNKLKAQQLSPSSRPGNTPILPIPKPIGQSTEKFGIDEYIDFDKDSNEIKMEIPMSKLMNPVENEKIRSNTK